VSLGIAITRVSSENMGLTSDNLLHDYSSIEANDPRLIARCITGLGPSGDDNTVLGGWFFSGFPVLNRECSSLAVQQNGADISDYAGVVDLYQCQTLSPSTEGVYTCMIMNSSMMIQTMRVGLYFSGRGKSIFLLRILLQNYFFV